MYAEMQRTWGNNAIDIPLPRFSELYKEQVRHVTLPRTPST